jgi:hypothetical protein
MAATLYTAQLVRPRAFISSAELLLIAPSPAAAAAGLPLSTMWRETEDRREAGEALMRKAQLGACNIYRYTLAS